jgi:hypothetical protein
VLTDDDLPTVNREFEALCQLAVCRRGRSGDSPTEKKALVLTV